MMAVSNIFLIGSIAVFVLGAVVAFIFWVRREPETQVDIEMKALLKKMRQERKEFDKSTGKQIKELNSDQKIFEKKLQRLENPKK